MSTPQAVQSDPSAFTGRPFAHDWSCFLGGLAGFVWGLVEHDPGAAMGDVLLGGLVTGALGILAGSLLAYFFVFAVSTAALCAIVYLIGAVAG